MCIREAQKMLYEDVRRWHLSFVNTSEGGIDYIWDVGGSTISREEDQAEYTFTKPGEYTVTLKAYNRLSCKRIDVAQKKIIVETLNTKIKADTTVCENTACQALGSWRNAV